MNTKRAIEILKANKMSAPETREAKDYVIRILSERPWTDSDMVNGVEAARNFVRCANYLEAARILDRIGEA